MKKCIVLVFVLLLTGCTNNQELKTSYDAMKVENQQYKEMTSITKSDLEVTKKELVEITNKHSELSSVAVVIEEKLIYIFSTAFTNRYDFVIEAINSDINMISEIEKIREETVKNYFTADGYHNVTISSFMSSGIYFNTFNRCNTSFNSLDIQVNDSNDPKAKVVEFKLWINVEYLDEKDDDLAYIEGYINIYLEDEWLVGNITIKDDDEFVLFKIHEK